MKIILILVCMFLFSCRKNGVKHIMKNDTRFMLKRDTSILPKLPPDPGGDPDGN